MLKEQGKNVFGIEKKTLLSNIFLVANPLVWYYTVLTVLQETLDKPAFDPSATFLVWCLHFSGLVFSALLGASLTKKIERNQLLKIWILLSVFSSLALFAIDTSSVLTIGFLSLLFGVSLGWGMPACMGYYTDCIPVENRGRASGLAMIVSSIGIVILAIIEINDVVILGMILAAWRLSSLIVFRLSKLTKEKQKMSASSYKLIISQKSFIMYFMPWVMFSLVNYLSTPLQLELIEAGHLSVEYLPIVQNGVMGISAIIGGLLIDFIGRKRVAIAGFVLIGLGTSVLGIYPENAISWYFNAITDGIALGFLLVIFVLTIWGDLSFGAPSDKLYALGVVPFFVSKFLELTVGGSIVEGIAPYALFSFTALFLFLAVLPLIYAPETLPEKHIKERELKGYLEKAKKEAEKYS